MSPLRDDALWQRIAAHTIGPADASLSFAARLARENRWSRAYAERVIGEYRRFCYLAMTAGQEVTPSDAVDQAWQLHLAYSRDYWQTFCPQVLGADFHHRPTRSGTAERGRFYRQAAFGEVPPAVSGLRRAGGFFSIRGECALTFSMLSFATAGSRWRWALSCLWWAGSREG